MADAPRAFLELTVGPFRLALEPRHVWAVEAAPEPHADGELHLASGTVIYADLLALFTGEQRPGAPFAIVVDPPNGASRVAIGVDRVDHHENAMRHPGPIPSLGLIYPALFAGAARAGDGILMILDPAATAQLVDEVGHGPNR